MLCADDFGGVRVGSGGVGRDDVGDAWIGAGVGFSRWMGGMEFGCSAVIYDFLPIPVPMLETEMCRYTWERLSLLR